MVSLEKGGNVSLTKEAPGMSAGMVGLGWDIRATEGQDFDLDASAFLLGADGKVRNDNDFVYFKNLKGGDNSVQHQGDNLTGAGEGDDEQILIDLNSVPADVQKVAITVNIYDAASRGQTFGQVSNAFARLVNVADDSEVCRFDLGEDYSAETSMIVCEVYRHNDEWKFKAVGQGFTDGFPALVKNYGVNA